MRAHEAMGAQTGKGYNHGAGKEEPHAGKKELGARVRCADGEQLVAKLDARKGTAPKQTADDAQQQGSPRGPEDGGDPWLDGARCDVVRRHAFDVPSRSLAVLPRAYPIAETGLVPQLMLAYASLCQVVVNLVHVGEGDWGTLVTGSYADCAFP